MKVRALVCAVSLIVACLVQPAGNPAWAQEAGKPAQGAKAAEAADPAAALFANGWARHSAGNFQEAVRIYKEVSQKYPESDWAARALGCMGWDLTILRRNDEAIEVWQRILREYPDSKYGNGSPVAGQAAYSIAECLYAKADVDQAMAALDQAVQLCPDARGGENDGNLRSEMFLHMIENEDEQRAAAQAMEGGPPVNSPEYLYYRACHMKWDEALKACQKLLNQYPGHKLAAAALANTAWTLSALGFYDEAIARYRKILDEYRDSLYLNGKPVAPRAAWSLACCYYVKGDMANAKKAFGFALERYPDINVKGRLYGEVFLTLIKKVDAAVEKPEKGSGK